MSQYNLFILNFFLPYSNINFFNVFYQRIMSQIKFNHSIFLVIYNPFNVAKHFSQINFAIYFIFK